ncbi:DUF6446 family protein [Amylibacter sp.]|nr:DUF6446 family protein [Amylibacter sp.]
MNGNVMVGGLIAVALAAGAGLWYSQTYAYYEKQDGLEEVLAFGDAFPVSNYRGIDADTSPLKLRACFTVDWDYAPSETYKTEAEPLTAPSWFDCFDAEAISKDIAADNAVAILAEKNQPFGFSRFIAQYPDGNAFMWRQINECGRAQFDGDDLPDGCEEVAMVIPKPAVKTPGVVSGGIGPVDVTIALTPVNGGVPEEILLDGLSATSDNAIPESLWACFETPLSMGLLTESYEVTEDVMPTNPVSSLPCFDAENVVAAITDGEAVAFVGERDVWPGVDRVVAVYQNGRAVAWNQRRAN